MRFANPFRHSCFRHGIVLSAALAVFLAFGSMVALGADNANHSTGTLRLAVRVVPVTTSQQPPAKVSGDLQIASPASYSVRVVHVSESQWGTEEFQPLSAPLGTALKSGTADLRTKLVVAE